MAIEEHVDVTSGEVADAMGAIESEFGDIEHHLKRAKASLQK